MKTIKFLLMGSIFLLTACSGAKVFSDSDLKNETGVKYYLAKPYLLLQYSASAQDTSKKGETTVSSKTDSTIKTSVIYLPDLEHPQYVKYKSGIGSNDLKLTLSNGILVSYGLTTDTKIPETISSVADVLTSVSSVVTAARTKEPANIENKKTKPIFELYEIIMKDGITNLRKVEVK